MIVKGHYLQSLFEALSSGLRGNSSTIVHLGMRSWIDPKVNAYVLSKITSYLPERNINTSLTWLYTSLCLADPGFKNPPIIDILLGAAMEVIYKYLQLGHMRPVQ